MLGRRWFARPHCRFKWFGRRWFRRRWVGRKWFGGKWFGGKWFGRKWFGGKWFGRKWFRRHWFCRRRHSRGVVRAGRRRLFDPHKVGGVSRRMKQVRSLIVPVLMCTGAGQIGVPWLEVAAFDQTVEGTEHRAAAAATHPTVLRAQLVGVDAKAGATSGAACEHDQGGVVSDWPYAPVRQAQPSARAYSVS